MHEGGEGTKGIAGEDELPVEEPEVAETLVILRRRLLRRLVRPVPGVSRTPPRGFLPPF